MTFWSHSSCPVTTCPRMKSLFSSPVGPLWVLEGAIRLPQSLLFFRLNKTKYLGPPWQERCSSPWSPSWPFSGLTHFTPEGPWPYILDTKPGFSIPSGVSWEQSWEDSSPSPCWPHWFWCNPHTVGFLDCKCLLLGRVEFLGNQHPKPFSSGLFLNPFSTHPVLAIGIAWPTCRILHLALLNFMMFISQACQGSSGWHSFPPKCQLHDFLVTFLYLKDTLIWKVLGQESHTCAKSKFFCHEVNDTLSCHKHALNIPCTLRVRWPDVVHSWCAPVHWISNGSWSLFLPVSVKAPGPQEEAWSHIYPPTLSWTEAHAQVSLWIWSPGWIYWQH